MVIDGKNYTGFQNVRIQGTPTGNGTLITSGTQENTRTITLPNKSGIVPIQGTVIVHLPAVAATTFLYTTVLTVSGIRSNDALTASFSVASVYTSARMLHAAVPGDGIITLTMANIGAVGLGDYAMVLSYVASR